MEEHKHVINMDKVANVSKIDLETTEQMAVLFKMFGDATRLKIMQVLLDDSLNVCEIAYLLKMTHSAISHQLATLKMLNLVKVKKIGKESYYSLADEHIHSLIAIGKEHVMEDE